MPRLQRHTAGRHHLADQQIGVRLVGRAACRRALGVSQDQVQVLRAQLRHARHAACFHVQGVAGAQVQLQVLAAIVLIDAVGVARAAHDVLVGHQADLADALQRAGVGADDGAALCADRDGDAFLGMDVAQADAALRRVQAHRGVAIRGHHAVDGLHRERARQFQRQIARVTHVAHQHAGAQRLRAGAILRHVRHADLAPYRIQETAADIHHLHAVGARGIDIGLQLAALAGRCALQHLAVVDEDVAAVLVQVETVGKQELDGAVGRQRPAQHQRRIVGEQRLEALPQRRVGEIDAGAVQRHGAGRADVAVKRVIDARQIDRVGARQDGLVGLRQRVEHVGAVGLRQPAQAGQLQGVVAEFGADRALARGAQHDVRARLHVQEAVGGRCALAAAFQVEDLLVDGRRHRIQQVVLDIAQRRRREIEEMARIIGLAVQGDLLRGLRGRVGTHRIDARIRLYPRPVQAGRVERQRDGLAQVRVQRQQAVVLPGAGLVEHGVGQRCRQPDRAVRADDGVIGRVGPHVAHGMPEIDLVARAQGTQLPGAVIDDIHVGQLETAIRHGDQSGDCRSKGGFQPIAPVVVVLGRLRQFLVDHIVVDDLIARRLDQVLGRCDVQRGRQVVGIEALVAQLFMQRLQLGAQALGGTRRLRLEQMRGNGEHAAHVRRRKAAQQFTRDAGIREQRLGQRLPFGRLVQRLDLLIQHRLFLGGEQLDRIVGAHQHVIGHIGLQARHLAGLQAHVVQVHPVEILQAAVARHLTVGVSDRHDIHVGQRDHVVGLHRSAARGRVQQPDSNCSRSIARQGQDLAHRDGVAAVEGAVHAVGQGHHAPVHALHVVDDRLRRIRKAQFDALALHQAVRARQRQRGHAELRQGLLREARIDQADACIDGLALQGRRIGAGCGRIVDVGVLVYVQVHQLRFLRVDLAAEGDAAGQPVAIGTGGRQRIAVGIDDGQDVQRAVVVDAQLVALQGAVLVGHVQLQTRQRDRLPALQQRLDAVGQLRPRAVAQARAGQIPAEAVAHVHVLGVARAGARFLRIGVEWQQVAAIPTPVGRRRIGSQHALLERRGAEAALHRVGHGQRRRARTRTLAQAGQAVHQFRRQAGRNHRAQAVADVVVLRLHRRTGEGHGHVVLRVVQAVGGRTVRLDQAQGLDAARIAHAVYREGDLAADQPVPGIVHPLVVGLHRGDASWHAPAQLRARKQQLIGDHGAFDHGPCAIRRGGSQVRV